jgi:Mrp family chromosome partitioning ATPase
LQQNLRDLEVARGLNDPTIRLETVAVPHSTPVSPRPALSLVAALLAGLLVGSAIVLGSQLLDPRVRREEQLRRYRIPILARVPTERLRRNQKHVPLLPMAISPAAHDAYLLLGATLAVGAEETDNKRSVLVTGPNPGDGKSTSALNLAAALSGREPVVLIEADTRRPSLARALGVRPSFGVSSVLARKTPLNRALIPFGAREPDMQLLVQSPTEAPLGAVMTPSSAAWLLDEVQLLVNWVVVDAPPLALVPDALSLANEVDEIILVVRLGNTRLTALEELAELLVQQGLTPAGFVVIGGRRNATYYGR